MSFYKKTGVSLLVFVFAVFGFAQISHALTQSDVDLICIIVDCDKAGIRDTLESLVDDESEEITRNLFRGISGDDVTALQELLATDPEVYPEGLITGFYGPLTEQAVIRFQEKFGIESVGTVGPITRGTLNKLFKKHKKGRNILDEVVVDDDEDLDDDIEVEDEDEDNDEDDNGNRGRRDHKVIICHKSKTIAVGAPAVQAHLRNHGDEIGACDGTDEPGEEESGDDEPADETVPEISNVDSTDIATTTATIIWETDGDSDSTVWYATSTGFSVDDDGVEEESDSDLVTDHSIDLEDLEPSTIYYFIVGSEDEAGNLATSTEDSFETDSE